MRIRISAKVHYDAGDFVSGDFSVSSLPKARVAAESFCMGVASVIGSHAFTVHIRERFFNPESRQDDYREIESFDFVA